MKVSDRGEILKINMMAHFVLMSLLEITALPGFHPCLNHILGMSEAQASVCIPPTVNNMGASQIHKACT